MYHVLIKEKSIVPKLLKDLKFDPVLAKWCIPKALENIRKPKISLFLWCKETHLCAKMV